MAVRPVGGHVTDELLPLGGHGGVEVEDLPAGRADQGLPRRLAEGVAFQLESGKEQAALWNLGYTTFAKLYSWYLDLVGGVSLCLPPARRGSPHLSQGLFFARPPREDGEEGQDAAVGIVTSEGVCVHGEEGHQVVLSSDLGLRAIILEKDLKYININYLLHASQSIAIAPMSRWERSKFTTNCSEGTTIGGCPVLLPQDKKVFSLDRPARQTRGGASGSLEKKKNVKHVASK